MLTDALIDLNEVIPPPEDVLTVDGITWGTLGNFTTVMGKAKSKKTFLITACVAAALGTKTIDKITGHLPEGKKTVVWFDTEQSKYHVQKAAKRAIDLKGGDSIDFKVYSLRSYKTELRFGFVQHVINNTPALGLVVIDGVRDILKDINSQDEATEISDALMKWSEEKHIHIVTVLHANKTDSNLRGAIGTELLNKSETVINVVNEDGITVVSCDYSRNRPFEDFAFWIDNNGLPQGCDVPVKGAKKQFDPETDIGKDVIVKALLKIYPDRNKWKSKKELLSLLSMNINTSYRNTEAVLFFCETENFIKNISDNKNKKYVLQSWVGITN